MENWGRGEGLDQAPERRGPRKQGKFGALKPAEPLPCPEADQLPLPDDFSLPNAAAGLFGTDPFITSFSLLLR
jgi:hypothetical protein